MSDTIEIHTGPLGAVVLLLGVALVFLLGALFDRRLTRWREMRAAKARFLAARGAPLVEMFTPTRPHRPGRIIASAPRTIHQVIPPGVWTRLRHIDAEVLQATGGNVHLQVREADRG